MMKLSNKIYRFAYCAGFLFFVCTGCDRKQTVAEKTKELVFVVNLVNDESKIGEYLNYHKQVWPEVEAGFKKAGYKEIRMYRYKASLVMLITIPEAADINLLGKMAETYDKKCAEWNRMMSNYQEGVNGTEEGQKWVHAELFYSFKNE